MEDPLLSVQRGALDEVAASGLLRDSLVFVDEGAACALESLGGLHLLLQHGKPSVNLSTSATLHCSMYTSHRSLYTFHGLLCRVYCLFIVFIVYYVLFNVHCVTCTVCSLLFTAHSLLYTVYCILFTSSCVVFTVYCTVYSVQPACTANTYCVLCTVYK